MATRSGNEKAALRCGFFTGRIFIRTSIRISIDSSKNPESLRRIV